MNRFILICICFLINSNIFSQTIVWERKYSFSPNSPESFNSITFSSDSSNIIAYGIGGADSKIYFVNYDLNGNIIWTKPGLSNVVWSGDIARLNNGGYLYSTFKSNGFFGATDIILQRISSLGDTLPKWKFGDGISYHHSGKILLLPDGSILNAVTDDGSFSLLKVSSAGNGLWLKSYPHGGPPNDVCYEVEVNRTGNYLLLGKQIFLAAPLYSHPKIIEVNPYGDSIRSKVITIKQSNVQETVDFANLLQTSRGEYVFTANIDTLNNTDQLIGRFGSITKLDSSFNKKWTTVLRPSLGNYYAAARAFEMKDSSYLVLACHDIIDGWKNTFDIFKISVNGNIISKKSFTSAICDSIIVNDMLLLNDSSVVVSGECGKSQGSYIARINKIGNAINIDTCKSFKANFIAKQISDTVFFINTSNGGFAYADQSNWKLSDSSSSGNFTYKETVSGLQDSIWARLIAVNPYGCKDTIAKKVKIVHPNAIFDPDRENINVTVYPNPFSDFTTFRFLKEDKYSLTIYDIIGKELATYHVNSNEFKLYKDSFSVGLYFYKIIDKTGNSLSGRLLIE